MHCPARHKWACRHLYHFRLTAPSSQRCATGHLSACCWPTMASIDTQTDVLGQMIRTVSSGGATSSNASTTIFHLRCHINYFQCICCIRFPHSHWCVCCCRRRLVGHKYYSDTRLTWPLARRRMAMSISTVSPICQTQRPKFDGSQHDAEDLSRKSSCFIRHLD